MQEAVGVRFAENPDLYKRLSPAVYFERELPALMFLRAEYEHLFPNSITSNEVDRIKSSSHRVQADICKRTEHGFSQNTLR